MINNKLYKQAAERIERDNERNAHMELYYNLIANGKTSREAKRHMKRKYKFIVE